jgi:exopolysaccharide biosynthesis protein
VDLDHPALEIVVNGRSSMADGPHTEGSGVIPGTTVSGFVRDYGCVAGINTNPFDRVSAVVGEPRTIAGITLTEGFLAAPPDSRYDALVFYSDGSSAIVGQADLDDEALAKVRNAVGGFFVVLRDGAIAERLLPQDAVEELSSGSLQSKLQATRQRRVARHPRSAAGLSADGRTLYLLAIDGRRLGSVGATEGEIAVILQRLGAKDGLNFDGGGSTALVLRYGDGRIRAVNTPIHGMIPGKERAVATCLGIRVRDGKEL